jgi:hypothetical protein
MARETYNQQVKTIERMRGSVLAFAEIAARLEDNLD